MTYSSLQQRENGNEWYKKINGKSDIYLQINKRKKKATGRLHIEGRLNEGPRLQRKHKDENEAKQNKGNTGREEDVMAVGAPAYRRTIERRAAQ